MSRTRTGTLSAAAALLAAAAMVTTAQSARADPWTDTLACMPTAPTHVVGAGPYGATWISNGVLVSPVYQQEGAIVNCLYVGDQYQYAAGTTTSLGRAQFYDRNQIYSRTPHLP